MPPERPARLWPYLLLYAAVAAALTFSRLHELHTSDSYIFSLSALYEWRPFFWEQDRVGMLWALLVGWVQYPLAVLLLHTFSTAFAGLCMPLLLARAITPHPAGPVVATGMSAAVLARGPNVVIDNWLLACNFPASLTFALAAVLLFDRRGGGWKGVAARAVVGSVLLFASLWLYAGVVLFLVPFGVLRGWLPGAVPARSWWGVVFRPLLNQGLILLAVGTAAAAGGVYALMEHAYASSELVYRTPTRELPQEKWADVADGLYKMISAEPGIPQLTWLFGCVSGAGLVAAVVVGVWRRGTWAEIGRTVLRVLPPLAAAVGETAFLCTRYWVLTNGCHVRYLIADITAACLVAGLLGLVPLLGTLPRRWLRATGGVAGAGLVAAAVWSYGLPTPDTPRRVMDERRRVITEDLVAAEVDGIGGDYWQVWPAVFHTNLALLERGERRVVWGVTKRSGPWEYRWRNTGRTYRVGVWAMSGREGDDWPGEAEKRGLTVVRELPRVGFVRVFEVRSE